MRADNYQKAVKIVVTAAPATEPVTLAELKAQLRIDHTDEDTLLGTYIQAAREICESMTGRRMITRTEKLFLDFFPPCDTIVIPAAPVSAVGAIVTRDEDEVPTAFASTNYIVDTSGPVAKIVLKSGSSWATLASNAKPVNAIEIPFTSGYASALAVPENMKLALKLLAGHYYENREDSSPLTIKNVPNGVLAILTPLRVWEALI